MTAQSSVNRRHFVQGTAAFTAAALASGAFARAAAPNRVSKLRYGVIGCGGRGTGAALNALEASPDVEIVALADVVADRLAGAKQSLAELEGDLSKRVKVDAKHCFVGFEAYQELCALDLDVVILATAPGFRPIHLAAAIAAGKHAFMEKPAGVDPTGVRSVLASAKLAREKKLSIVAGTQRRHEQCYREAMARVQAGAIGEITHANCYWNQGSLWVKQREQGWSDTEWQVRNWLYFAWLSGDHICEQHVHNLDVCNWAIGSHPLRATGMGGRQVRVAPEYGNIFDHFAIDYEYANGVRVSSYCRQIDGCAGRVEEIVHGTEGVLYTASNRAEIVGKQPWKFTGEQPNPYVQEHADLIAAIQSGTPVDEATAVAESTLTAVMGRMSAYTGKELSWEQALASKLDLVPARCTMGPLAIEPVAVPGKTPFV
ncbi:MAG: Gfo/Idh/MocA family oxidoreductase [Planctomycetes bacterium]|nr:Gfo/Idh/MocA family oxidoreductase [Planctomycetota bacterium]